MEGRIKLSPVLSAPPTKESDPFLHVGYSSAVTALQAKHISSARRNAASNGAFSFSQCAISARDLSSRASDLGLDVHSVLFVLPKSSIQGALRLGDRSLPSLSFLLLGGLFLRAFGAGLRHALLCATYSRSPTLSTFPLLPLDGLSNDRYRLRPSQRSQHLEWPLCAISGRSYPTHITLRRLWLQQNRDASKASPGVDRHHPAESARQGDFAST